MAGPSIEQGSGPEAASPGGSGVVVPPVPGCGSPGSPADQAFREFKREYGRLLWETYDGNQAAHQRTRRLIVEAYQRWGLELGPAEARRVRDAAKAAAGEAFWANLQIGARR